MTGLSNSHGESRVWTADGFVNDDPWALVESGAPVAVSHPVLALSDWLAPAETGEIAFDPVGVVLAPDDDAALLGPHLSRLSLVVLRFDKFNDGRAFSQAAILRERFGYGREIRATGDVLLDQIPFMLRSGITSFVVSNPFTLARLAENRLPAVSRHYQPAANADTVEGGRAWRRLSLTAA